MLVSVTQKSRVGCPSRRKKHASGVHRQVEYTHFLALGDARTGSLRLLPFCLRHLTYFCWQPIRAQAEGTWHWRPYWRESTRPGRWHPRSTFGLTRRRTGLWTFLKITSASTSQQPRGTRIGRRKSESFCELAGNSRGQRVSTVLSLKHV